MRPILHNQDHRQTSAGFTLVELLVVVGLLSMMLGIVFTYVNRLQNTYRKEETQVDATQQTRNLLDELGRELHQAGYPGHLVYAPGVLINPEANDRRTAVGLVKISPSELWFEGDIDNDGVVESVHYRLLDSSGNPVTGASTCPCVLQRSQVQKQNAAPLAQASSYNSSLNNVINSGGVGGGGGPLALIGSSVMIDGPTLANDTLYTGYKTPPVFRALDQSGNALALPLDLSTIPYPPGLNQVKSVVITLNVLSTLRDPQTGMQPALSMTTTVKLSN